MADHAAEVPQAREETPEQKYLRQIRDSVYFIAAVVFVCVAFGILYAVAALVRTIAAG